MASFDWLKGHELVDFFDCLELGRFAVVVPQ
jgi:hypothetical protein